MNPTEQAVAAYGDVTSTTKSPRQVEYQAFAKITNALRSSAASQQPDNITATAPDAQNAFTDMASALHDNLRLWTIVLGDVSGDGNALPESLRARLFYLAEFTRDHTRRILKGEADPAPLIEINTAVMRGLRQAEDTALCPA